MMFPYKNYKVEFSYYSETKKKRITESEYYGCEYSAQNAVNRCRVDYQNYKDLRIESVYFENYTAWEFTDAWE